jgi:hypothetical protein
MRIPRFQLTNRRLLAAVTVLAIPLGGVALFYHHRIEGPPARRSERIPPAMHVVVLNDPQGPGGDPGLQASARAEWDVAVDELRNGNVDQRLGRNWATQMNYRFWVERAERSDDDDAR